MRDSGFVLFPTDFFTISETAEEIFRNFLSPPPRGDQRTWRDCESLHTKNESLHTKNASTWQVNVKKIPRATYYLLVIWCRSSDLSSGSSRSWTATNYQLSTGVQKVGCSSSCEVAQLQRVCGKAVVVVDHSQWDSRLQFSHSSQFWVYLSRSDTGTLLLAVNFCSFSHRSPSVTTVNEIWLWNEKRTTTRRP